jgi:hypothetical protein
VTSRSQNFTKVSVAIRTKLSFKRWGHSPTDPPPRAHKHFETDLRPGQEIRIYDGHPEYLRGAASTNRYLWFVGKLDGLDPPSISDRP